MNLQIRPITLNDFDAILRWSKDTQFCSANDWEQHRDEHELYDWWKCCVTHDSPESVRFAIDLNHQLIGYADLVFINENTAELGIAIGESRLLGKGIGLQASLRMMADATKHYGISIFHAETHETNHRARAMLKNLGFVEVSRIGNEVYQGIEAVLIQYEKNA